MKYGYRVGNNPAHVSLDWLASAAPSALDAFTSRNVLWGI